MKYLLVVVVWLVTSFALGVLGAAFGPGVAMVLFAVAVGAVGACIDGWQVFRKIRLPALGSALLTAGTAYLLWLLAIDLDGATFGGVIYFFLYFLLLGVAGSFLCRLLVRW